MTWIKKITANYIFSTREIFQWIDLWITNKTFKKAIIMIITEITKWGHIPFVLCSDIGPIANNSPCSTVSTSRLFRCLSISKISRLNLSSLLLLHNLYLVHPQQYIGVNILSTMRTTMRNISIINTIMKNNDPASNLNFIRFLKTLS